VFLPIISGKIEYTVNKLRVGKSPGHDLITNKILKNLKRKCILFLTFIYNRMLTLSYFPSLWKSAIIISIHETGKPKYLSISYRPISLPPKFVKLFDKLLLKRIRQKRMKKELSQISNLGFVSNT